MIHENVKYIDATLEGSLLKYDLDEPLIAGNQNIYYFRISLANIDEAQNSVWKLLLSPQSESQTFEAEFKSLISQVNEASTVLLSKDGDYLIGKVPDGSTTEGNQLYGGYRMLITVRGSGIVNNETINYCTKELSNPPMVYSSGNFKTTIDLAEETFLRSFMSKFTGGEPGEIIVKRSDNDYDIDWKKSLPNQLIFGGHGTFIETGDYEVVLTPAAQEILIERGKLELTGLKSMAEPADDYPAFEKEISLRKIIIDFSKPEDYTGLEFLSTNQGEYTFEGVQTKMHTGDKVTSDGFGWGLVKASAAGMEGTSFSTTTINKGIYTDLPSYEIKLNNSAGSINLPSLLPNGDLTSLRNMSSYAGKVQDLVGTEKDLASKWRTLGTCFFKVYENSKDYITMPTDVDKNGNLINITENGFVENLIILGEAEIVFQRLTTNSGRRFYRSNSPLYGKWPEWTEKFDYNQILPIANGGTDATTVVDARKNLEVYSQTEVDDKLAQRASLTQNSSQIFQGHVSGISLTSRETPNEKAVFINLDKADGGPAAKFWKSLSSGNTYLTTYPLEATDITDRINYVFTAPNKDDGNIERYVYHTGNLIYKGQKPSFDSSLYPAGTICLVKVSE